MNLAEACELAQEIHATEGVTLVAISRFAGVAPAEMPTTELPERWACSIAANGFSMLIWTTDEWRHVAARTCFIAHSDQSDQTNPTDLQRPECGAGPAAAPAPRRDAQHVAQPTLF